MKKKSGLVIAVLVLLLNGIIYAADGDLGASKGADGSEAMPWLIEDFDDFDAFCGDDSKWAAGEYTRLESDIDLDPALPSRVIYTQAPIAGDTDTDYGFDGTAYAGSFDGNDHVINNLHINGVDYCGLFGKAASDSEISNLGIENASITGSGNYLGGLCGYNNNGTISNCYAASSVSGDSFLGGLCGYNNNGTISNCYATGTVSGDDYLGGLCGYNKNGTISNCYATGTVSGGDYSRSLGGLCGENSGIITNCFATSSVFGRNNSGDLGGLCGQNNDGIISNCYAIGSVSGGYGSYNPGGLCGQNNDGIISNCFFYKYGSPDNNCGLPLNDSQLQDSASFTGFDFTGDSSDGTEDIWSITTGYMPRLYWQSSTGFTPPYLLDDISTTLSGTGYPDDPFIISNFDDMIEFRSNTSLRIGCYSLQNDIDLSGTTYPDAFIPEYFYGYFDGNGFTISNLSIDGSDYLGMFAIFSGSINSLDINNVNINSSGSYFGGLCGKNYYGTISNCYVTASVTGYDYLGGLCGNNDNGTITNCYVTGTTTGISKVGGFCGNNDNGTITNCYITGTMTGASGVGGFCGENNNGVISDCYATGSVSGDHQVGGLCGGNYGGTISNCYVIGTMTGASGVGGFCGTNIYGIIRNCYATGTVSGIYDYVGGFCGGIFDGRIDNSYATGTVSGADKTGGFCGYVTGISVIKNCYSICPVDSSGSNIGGFIGYVYSDDLDIIKCFWDVESSGLGISGEDNYGATGKTTSEMQTLLTYFQARWLISNTNNHMIWYLPENDYPKLSMIEYPVLAGSGTEIAPYLINDIYDFIIFSDVDNSETYWSENVYTQLTFDLDLEIFDIFTEAPIAPGVNNGKYGYLGSQYFGMFDGNCHTISNLSVDGTSCSALFGNIGLNSCIRNLCLENVNVIASGAYESSWAGGLCGINSGYISGCCVSGQITGFYFVGGVCGFNEEGTIRNCYTSGSISGKAYLGGVCGYNFSSNCFISNCYSTCTISGGDDSFYLGGLCGYNYGTISNCYATGSVSGYSELGGLCGYQSGNSSEISNSFWDTQTSGMSIGVNQDSSYPGTVTNLYGLTTTEMQEVDTFLGAGWDFVGEDGNGSEDLWREPYFMPGYPILAWEKDIPGDIAGGYGVNLEDFGYLSKSWQDNYTITDLQTLTQYWLEGIQ